MKKRRRGGYVLDVRVSYSIHGNQLRLTTRMEDYIWFISLYNDGLRR
jgi:hypothetical protein